MDSELGNKRRFSLTALGAAGLLLALVGIVFSDISPAVTLAGLVVILFVVVGLNLTVRSVDRARRRAARMLRSETTELDAQLHLQAAIFSSLSIGVLAFRDGQLVVANSAARSMIGERLVSVDGLAPAAVREAVDKTAANGRSHSAKFDIDYPARTVEATAHALPFDRAVVLQLADVSQRQQADSVRRDFVAAASHELKTPVAAIQAAAETVLTALHDDPEAVANFSRRIYDNATRLAQIVADLLDLSRLETETVPMELLDIGAVASDEAARFSAEDVKLVIDVEHVAVRGSSADIALAIRNLLDNAARYSHAGGRVTLRVKLRDHLAVIEVADNGVGIPHQDLPRIFERFYRVDAARSRATGGTGLGLAIVKHVAEQHGGAVEADSVLGQGSTFRILLPQGGNGA